VPAGRPWYQRNPADFIMAVRGFDLETVGAYSLIIDHLNDRDRPLPDDDRFMAGLLHCSPQRWRKLRAFLIDHDKLIVTPDGYLTNRRFEREKAKRQGDSETAQLFGRAGGLERARRAGQAELDLDAGWEEPAPSPRAPARAHGRTESAHNRKSSGQTSPEVRRNFRESSGDQSHDRKQKPNEIKARTQPPPQAPCAREESRDQSKDSTLPNPRDSDSRGRLDDLDDLDQLTAIICEAAGHSPSNRAQLDRARTHVHGWREAEVSFDRVVLPTIMAAISKTDAPTRTLGRFRADIALEHARAVAQSRSGQPYQPPAAFEVEDADDPRIGPLRERLRRSVGDRPYDGWLRPTALEIDGKVLRVTAPSPFMADWVRSHFERPLREASGCERLEVRTV
jgi:uncharacterized protein YdaU (DUF1376 family)